MSMGSLPRFQVCTYKYSKHSELDRQLIETKDVNVFWNELSSPLYSFVKHPIGPMVLPPLYDSTLNISFSPIDSSDGNEEHEIWNEIRSLLSFESND